MDKAVRSAEPLAAVLGRHRKGMVLCLARSAHSSIRSAAGDAIRPPALDEPSLGSLIFEKEAKQLRQAQPLAEGFAGSVGRNVSHGGTSIRSLHSGFRHFAA